MPATLIADIVFMEASSPPDKLPDVIDALDAPEMLEEVPYIAFPFSEAVFILLTKLTLLPDL